jgi:Tol biopolymer transport system component
MNPGGSDQRNLTNNAAQDFEPAWSADGEKIAFTSTRDEPGLGEIYVMNADGSGVKRLTSSAGFDFSPTWSPDGDKIAFSSSRAGTRDIWVMDADGSNPKQLTSDPGGEEEPTWSSDGERIAFTSDQPGLDSEIYVMDAGGGDQKNLTNSPAADDADACWSPDDDQLVFTSAPAAGGFRQIWKMDADGSDQKNLSNSVSSSFDDISACFSPDGEKIVFSRDTGPDRDLFLMDADGSDQHDVTNNATGSDLRPSWQSDDVTGDVTVTKWVNGTPAPGTTFTVEVKCDNGDDTFTKTLTFGETGGTQAFERESFGPLECDVTEPQTGGATAVQFTCANGENTDCKDSDTFELFDDPGGDHTKVDITVTNTFPVTAEPNFTG